MIKCPNLCGGTMKIENISQIGNNCANLAATDYKSLTLLVLEEKRFKRNSLLHQLAIKVF